LTAAASAGTAFVVAAKGVNTDHVPAEPFKVVIGCQHAGPCQLSFIEVPEDFIANNLNYSDSAGLHPISETR